MSSKTRSQLKAALAVPPLITDAQPKDQIDSAYNLTDDTINTILPVQTGQSGKALVTNGTAAGWASVISPPGGSSGQVQFNNSGAFGGSANLTWDNATHTFVVKGAVSQTADLFQSKDSAGNVGVRISSHGKIIVDGQAEPNEPAIRIVNPGGGTSGFEYTGPGNTGNLEIHQSGQSWGQPFGISGINRTLNFDVSNEAYDPAPQAFRFGQQIGSVQRTTVAIVGYAGQTAPLQEWRDSSGNPLASVPPITGTLRLYATPTQSIDLQALWDGANIFVGLANPTIGSAPAFRATKYGGTSFSPTNSYINVDGTINLHAYYDGGDVIYAACVIDTDIAVSNKLLSVRNHGTEKMYVDANGGIGLASMADTTANNSTMYFSTDAGKPVWKDSGGTVHNLY